MTKKERTYSGEWIVPSINCAEKTGQSHAKESNQTTMCASLMAQLVKNPPAMQETPVQLLGWEDPREKGQANHSVFLGFPHGSAGKESTCNVGDLSSIPGLGRSPGKGKGYPLQYSDLENSMDCIVHGVTKSWTGLSDFHLHFQTTIHTIHKNQLKME